jgi:hypothetical protein
MFRFSMDKSQERRFKLVETNGTYNMVDGVISLTYIESTEKWNFCNSDVWIPVDGAYWFVELD